MRGGEGRGAGGEGGNEKTTRRLQEAVNLQSIISYWFKMEWFQPQIPWTAYAKKSRKR